LKRCALDRRLGSCSDCVAVSNCCVDSNSGWKLDMVDVFPGD
jgi:hypothetical protein